MGLLILFLISLLSTQVFAQATLPLDSITLSGTLVQMPQGEPIPQAKLLFLPDSVWVTTDEDGFFISTLPTTAGVMIEFDHPELQLFQNWFALNPTQPFVTLVLQASHTSSSTTSSPLASDTMRVIATRQPIHDRKQISYESRTASEMRQVAASLYDPLRTLPTLPGVTSQNDLSVRPFVRGGKAEETRIFWNDIPLIQPYHLMSSFSVFNMEAIDQLDLYMGGFPVENNNALSAVLNLHSRKSPDSLELYAHISPIRFNVYAGAPIVPTKLGFYAAFQSFYQDWTMKRFLDLASTQVNSAEKEEIDEYKKLFTFPTFQDLNLGLDYKLNSNTTLLYSMLAAQDKYWVLSPSYNYYDEPDSLTKRNWLADLDTLAYVKVFNQAHSFKVRHTIDSKWITEYTTAWQHQNWDVKFDLSSNVSIIDDYIGQRYDYKESSFNHRWHNLYQIQKDHLLKFGLSYDLWQQNYKIQMHRMVYEMIVNGNADYVDGLSLIDPEGFIITTDANIWDINDFLTRIRFDLQGKHKQHYLAAYASDQWTINPRLRADLGLRLEHEAQSGDLFLAPRTSLFYSLNQSNELSFSLGLYSQNNIPFYQRHQNPHLKSEKAWLVNAEWSHDFSPHYRLELRNYGKLYYDLVEQDLKQSEALTSNYRIIKHLYNDLYDLANIPDLSTWDELLVAAGITEEELLERGQKLVDYIEDKHPEVYNFIGLNDFRINGYASVYSNLGKGYSAGTELTFRYDPNPVWRGWASLDFNVSRRRHSNRGVWYNFKHSRPWTLNWHNYFDLQNKYEIAIRYKAAAGLPYTRIRSQSIESDTLFIVEPMLTRRYAMYQRLDLGLYRNFELFGKPARAIFEVWNATNFMNFFLRDSETNRFVTIDFSMPIPMIFLAYEMRW
jgi:outer membrane receptor protein involved in Fe transport